MPELSPRFNFKDIDDEIWDNIVAEDFVKGYSKKDTAYDKL